MNGNVTLYAQWVPKDKVTINYVALSGGTVEPGHEYLNPDLDDAKGSVAKAKAGYVFGGWYDNEACSDRPVGENERFTPTRPDSGWADGTTYYAKFVAERTAYTVNHYKVNAAHTAATLDTPRTSTRRPTPPCRPRPRRSRATPTSPSSTRTA